MATDLTRPALVIWYLDEGEPPEDWADATPFPTLREALEAIMTGTPQTGHPWVLCNRRVFAPREVEELWGEDRSR